MWRARLDSDGLLATIAELAQKQREGKHPHALLGGELRFDALGDRAPQFARELSATISRGDYRAGPVVATRALIEGKLRHLYRAQPIDMIVNRALATELAPILESAFSDRLYSYRNGRSAWQAINAFVDYLRWHRGHYRHVKARGLYVLRRDVSAYGDSIPVSDDSVLWMQLQRVTQADDATWQLLRQALRPQLAGTDQHVKSVPTGSPLQPLMCNLYLTPVDDFANTIEGAFYARSGDDILFAHADATVTLRVANELERLVSELRLRFGPQKTLNLYFTGAGRPSSSWPDARGTTHLQYLGARIDFAGNVGLKTERARVLLHHLRRRVANTLRLIAAASIEDRAKAACATVKGALDIRSPQCEPAIASIFSVVNDRRQLKQLDHWIALFIASRVTGISGPRAFRKLGYDALRAHGLPSLVMMRQRRGSP